MAAMKAGIPRIPPAVARKLGHYVYLYVNPTNNAVFYVGKGGGGRALAHLHADEKKAITKVIQSIRRAGKEPRTEILAHKLSNSEVVLRVEAGAIDLTRGQCSPLTDSHGSGVQHILR